MQGMCTYISVTHTVHVLIRLIHSSEIKSIDKKLCNNGVSIDEKSLESIYVYVCDMSIRGIGSIYVGAPGAGTPP